jgi:hypothetical protein
MSAAMMPAAEMRVTAKVPTAKMTTTTKMTAAKMTTAVASSVTAPMTTPAMTAATASCDGISGRRQRDSQYHDCNPDFEFGHATLDPCCAMDSRHGVLERRPGKMVPSRETGAQSRWLRSDEPCEN